ncbi:hypothetical protein NDU88_003257 [Pleurodeles waltl]|uniref:Uncharacterized protein n=1 Tax=Pleurodeles waltl TaxID=8319 RepID=A0AAV7W4T7_PLEWA|nr:hypothetical protein NDU88_003257 [Pleurodeles waltl]
MITAAAGPQAEIQPQSGLAERDLPGLPSHCEAAEEIGGLALVIEDRSGGAGTRGREMFCPPGGPGLTAPDGALCKTG